MIDIKRYMVMEWILCKDRLPESWKSDIISKMWGKDVYVTKNVLVKFVPKEPVTEAKNMVMETYFRNGKPARSVGCINGIEYIPYAWAEITNNKHK